MHFDAIPDADNALATEVIGAALEVHKCLGVGFIESVYEDALCHELTLRGIEWQRQEEILVPYKDIWIRRQKVDLLVAQRVLVELKCVKEFAPIHQAKVISYLRSMNLRLGLLLNFQERLLKNGIKRIVL
jgi:GxxExxY protein